jgi:hypothetical protein
MSDINIPHTTSTLEGKYKRMNTEVLLREDMKLDLTTYRNSYGYLVTYATVSRKVVAHSEPFLYGHILGRDYNRMFKTAKVRVTANAVKAQHGEFLVNLASIMEDAKKYYGVTIVKVAEQIA